MKYGIYQIVFTDEQIEKINARDPSIQVAWNLYLNATNFPSLSAVRMAISMYRHVADIEAAGPNDVFYLGNHRDQHPHKITQHDRRMHSVSVGDVIVDPNGFAIFVAPVGFVSLPDFMEIRKELEIQ